MGALALVAALAGTHDQRTLWLNRYRLYGWGSIQNSPLPSDPVALRAVATVQRLCTTWTSTHVNA